METYSFDAVAFVPKVNIKFHGFGIFGSYNNKTATYKVKFAFDEEEPGEEMEIMKPDEEKDPENKWHSIMLHELGMKPMKVSAGTQIHIVIKVTSDDYEIRRCFYGTDGEEHHYNALEGQDQDFETKDSRFNGNCTSQSWG
jgi:hypothetical protein